MDLDMNTKMIDCEMWNDVSKQSRCYLATKNCKVITEEFKVIKRKTYLAMLVKNLENNKNETFLADTYQLCQLIHINKRDRVWEWVKVFDFSNSRQ